MWEGVAEKVHEDGSYGILASGINLNVEGSGGRGRGYTWHRSAERLILFSPYTGFLANKESPLIEVYLFIKRIPITTEMVFRSFSSIWFIYKR